MTIIISLAFWSIYRIRVLYKTAAAGFVFSLYCTKLLMLSVTTSVIQEYLLGYLQTIELGALGLSRTLLQRSCGGGAQVVQSWEVCGTRGLRGD